MDIASMDSKYITLSSPRMTWEQFAFIIGRLGNYLVAGEIPAEHLEEYKEAVQNLHHTSNAVKVVAAKMKLSERNHASSSVKK